MFGIGLNYRDHAAESGLPVPDGEPPVFTKFPSCITGPHGDIELPPGGHVDWEVELVAVIGRRAHRVPAARALEHVAGYAVGQDISERVLQLASTPPQFSMGKSLPGFGPVGPWLVTLDELADPGDLALGCEINGEPVQSSRTSQLIFGVPALVANLSASVLLLPGDIILRHPGRRRAGPGPAALARRRRRPHQPHRRHRRDAAPLRRRRPGRETDEALHRLTPPGGMRLRHCCYHIYLLACGKASPGRQPMTAQTDTSRDEIIARNLAAVETHFHNETPETIDQAIAVYTDDIVWEVPARGLVLRSIEDVKQEYLKIFGSMNIHKIVNLHRFATEEWVFDDSIFEWTITGDGFRNCPYPPGTTVSVRLLHAFQCRDGKICREHGYEIWRDINDHARVRDDIPATATVEVFG